MYWQHNVRRHCRQKIVLATLCLATKVLATEVLATEHHRTVLLSNNDLDQFGFSLSQDILYLNKFLYFKALTLPCPF
jgi:hypothetical protein